MDVMSLADRSWPVLRRLTGVHARVYQVTNGRIGHRFLASPPTLLLDHVGAKSATARTTPLFYAQDGPNIILVASKGGYPKHPAWYHNLLAHPDTTVQIATERRPVHARVAAADEHERLWAKAVAAYSGYEGYQRRAGRAIPIVVLEPRAEAAGS
jgi:deazaflavin-dependent oxidoreductase (nitroreductase family)